MIPGTSNGWASIGSGSRRDHFQIPHPFREGSLTDRNFLLAQQGYLEEYQEHRGKGSFPAMITPAYQNAKKANELASDVSTALGRPAEPQKQRGNEILNSVLTETSTQSHLFRPEPE